MRFRADAKRLWLLASAAALYVLIAWSVAPGFYDGFSYPRYAYVSPPPFLASDNVQPKPGAGELAIGPDGKVIGGIVNTRDQPQPQTTIVVVGGTLAPPSSGRPVKIEIAPYAIQVQPPGITLEGNIYCIAANTTLMPQSKALVSLYGPPDAPPPTTIYRSPDDRQGPWIALSGAKLDPVTNFISSSTDSLGCFAVGYTPPYPGGGLRLGGPILPIVTAAVIVLVLLAGIPLAIRRRRHQTPDSGKPDRD
jgi:hypothetical protein